MRDSSRSLLGVFSIRWALFGVLCEIRPLSGGQPSAFKLTRLPGESFGERKFHMFSYFFPLAKKTNAFCKLNLFTSGMPSKGIIESGRSTSGTFTFTWGLFCSRFWGFVPVLLLNPQASVLSLHNLLSYPHAKSFSLPKRSFFVALLSPICLWYQLSFSFLVIFISWFWSIIVLPVVVLYVNEQSFSVLANFILFHRLSPFPTYHFLTKFCSMYSR